MLGNLHVRFGVGAGVKLPGLHHQAGRTLDSPWQPGTAHYQPPHHLLVFEVLLAPACEPMNLGICDFPPFAIPMV